MAQKYKVETYTDGSVVLSNIRNNLGIPVLGSNNNLTATKVNQWYDGTVMTDAKVDGKIYLKFKSAGDLNGSYFKVNLPNDKELFLEKDTMAQMRALNSTEILLLKMGYYKGVRLNGYYVKGDTPAPIEYYLSNITDVDDGGGIISVNDIKLEHVFINDINLSYYGIKQGVDVLDNHERVNKAIVKSTQNGANIVSPAGHFDFYGTVLVPTSNTAIIGQSAPNTTWWYNSNDTLLQLRNPLDASLQNIKVEYIRFRDRLGNGEKAISEFQVRYSTFTNVEIWGSTGSGGWKTAGIYIDGDQLQGSWNNRYVNLKCANMDGVAHLLRTTQNNAVYFENASVENCGRTAGCMVWICGGNGIYYTNSHFENFNIAVRISPYDASFNLRSVSFVGCYFEANETMPNNRLIYITNKDKDGGTSRVINFTGLYIEGGYWSGHGCDYGIEIDVVSGNVVTGAIENVFYRTMNIALVKSSTAGERIKITGRVYDSIPLLDKTSNSNCYVEEQSAGYDITKVLNRYTNPSNPNGYYNIEKPYQFLRLTSTQTINSNSVLTVVSAQPSSAGNITLTLPLLADLGLENEILIFKGTDDANTITVSPNTGNQFNTPTPQSRNWNILTKVNQYIKVVKDTTAGWRVVDYGVMSRDKFLYNRNNPNGAVTAKSGTIYFQLDTSDIVVDVFVKTITDNDNLNWISIIPKNASTTIKGVVNQSVALPNISQADLVNTTAADVAALVSYINTSVVPLVNAIKASQNTELTNQRTAGQQAP